MTDAAIKSEQELKEQLEEEAWLTWKRQFEKTRHLPFASTAAPVSDFITTMKFMSRIYPDTSRKPAKSLTAQARMMIAEDAPEGTRCNKGTSVKSTLLAALTQAERESMGIAVEPGEHLAPGEVVRAVAQIKPRLLDKLTLPSERLAARRMLLSETFKGFTWSYRRYPHVDGAILARKWASWSKTVRDFVSAPVEEFAKVSKDGEIFFDRDAPSFIEAMLMDGFFTNWLKEKAGGKQ